MNGPSFSIYNKTGNQYIYIFARRNTYVHRFIVKNTIEESIHKAIANDSTGLWASQKFTIESLMELFTSTDIFAEAGQ